MEVEPTRGDVTKLTNLIKCNFPHQPVQQVNTNRKHKHIFFQTKLKCNNLKENIQWVVSFISSFSIQAILPFKDAVRNPLPGIYLWQTFEHVELAMHSLVALKILTEVLALLLQTI